MKLYKFKQESQLGLKTNIDIKEHQELINVPCDIIYDLLI